MAAAAAEAPVDDTRVFVRAYPQARAKCAPSLAAAYIRALLDEDDDSIMREDATALEKAAAALEDLAGLPLGGSREVQLPAAPAAANGPARVAGQPAAAAAAAVGQAQENGVQHKKEKKEKKKRKAEEPAAPAAEPAEPAPAPAANGQPKKKDKKRKAEARQEETAAAAAAADAEGGKKKKKKKDKSG